MNTHVDNNLKYVLYTNLKNLNTFVGLLEILDVNKTDKYVIIINVMSLKRFQNNAYTVIKIKPNSLVG